MYHFFPKRGHFFLPNDRNFGVIKKTIRKHDRIYVPNEYFKMVDVSSALYTVKELQTDQIYEFKKWWPTYYKRNCLSNDSFGKKIPKDQKITFAPSTYMRFEYDAKNKGAVVVGDSIDGLAKNVFLLLKPTTANISLPSIKAYSKKIPIKRKKIEDLRKVESCIGEDHMQFYKEIFNWPTEEEGSTQENVESDGEYDYVP